jgi:predicted metal-dependent peptidase
MDLDKRLSKAKTALILEHPFVGTIALNMPFTLSEEPPPGFPPSQPWTACTNGKRVMFNPTFIEPLTDEELKFLVAHECFHPMLEHNWRRHEREPRKWNRAGDYVINQLLVDDRIGKMPPDGLQSKDVYDAGGGTTDGIFKLLPDDPNDGDGAGGEGKEGWQDCEDGPGTKAEKDQDAAEMKVKVAQAAQAARMMGKMSVGLELLVGEILNPKVPWEDVLKRFVEKQRTDQRSWARPNRRFIPQGIYMPSADGEALGEILFGIDCSGSCLSDIPQFAGEMHCVQEDSRPSRLHVLYFDTVVSHYEVYEPGDELDIHPHGGGGTFFGPIFQYMKDNYIEPAAAVILTDLCSTDFGEAPNCPVLWVCNYDGADKPPFGEVVMM